MICLCARGDHHLVAVAAQECNYSVKKSSSNIQLDEGGGGGEEIELDDDGIDVEDESMALGLPGESRPKP